MRESFGRTTALLLVALLTACGTDAGTSGATLQDVGDSGQAPYGGGGDVGLQTDLGASAVDGAGDGAAGGDAVPSDVAAVDAAGGGGDGGIADVAGADAGADTAMPDVVTPGPDAVADAAADTSGGADGAGVEDAAPDVVAPVDVAPDVVAPWCGDGTCDPDETCSACTVDCGACPDPCGNGVCDKGLGEGCATCVKDCGVCPDPCGDGVCDGAKGETCQTCMKDCGGCPNPCGDGACNEPKGETCLTCEDDCGACPNPCGDGACTGADGETCSTCPADCGACPKCGDGTCNPAETCGSCPGDCGVCPPVCGDGDCNGTETCGSCAGDCGQCVPKCGDAACNGDETCSTCAADCGACPPKCGDGTCNGEESCASCVGDCGACAPTCGDGACAPAEACQSCPQDCGACPPAIRFQADFSEVMTGAVKQGGFVRLAYDPDRLPTCRGVKSGLPAWTVELFYTWDLSQEAQKVTMVQVNGQTGEVEPVEPTIQVPPGATDIWLWAHNSDVLGCEAWDSDFGKNYQYPVFSPEELSQPIGWTGNFHFIRATDGTLEFLGDVDPAWYFATMADGGVTTWVQVEAWVPGVTDRAYQNADVTAQVAATAIVAEVRTDATEGAVPGGPMVTVPLQFVGKAGNNFAYRWAPASLIGGAVPLLLDGAYQYRFELRTPAGDVTGVGKPGSNDEPRVYVLASFPNCALFPYNPPSGDCQ